MVESLPVLEAQDLSRAFGRLRAVDGLSFALSEGQSLALFGPNGAGKTTLLRLLAGLLRPTAGRATISGADTRTDATTRGRVGLISHQSMLYPALTSLENVEFAARLHGVVGARDKSMRALETLGIASRASSPVRTLSRGMQQRVSIARAIVHGPVILLLDEPYTGLDASGAVAVSAMLHRLRANGATMVVVTHNVVEGLAVASHSAIMLAGQFVRFEATGGVDAVAYAQEYRDLAASQTATSPLAAA
jgi:heme ABC exporter ATP-binding subunit CcmA